MSGKKKLDFARWAGTNDGLFFLTRDPSPKLAQSAPFSIKTYKGETGEIRPLGLLEFGKISGYFIDGGLIYFVFPTAETLLEGEDVFVAGEFNEWKAQGKETWKLKMISWGAHEFLGASFSLRDVLVEGKTYYKFVTSEGRWLGVSHEAPNRSFNSEGSVNFFASLRRSGRHAYAFVLEEGYQPKGIERVVMREENLSKEECAITGASQAFLQSGTQACLGSWVEDGQTGFRIFAPRADKVELVIYIGEEKTRRFSMEWESDGTWSYFLEGNRHGLRYYYFITGRNVDGTTFFDDAMPIVDPWAKACDGHDGPAIVIDDTWLPQPDDFSPPDWHDLVICESHVRDVLAQAPLSLSWEERRGFAGLAKYVRQTENYFTELGVNAVELQPVQQNDSQSADEYHWGYMTTNYFSIHHGYGSAPQEMSQIHEFAEAVKAFHERGIAVILDVVYNHVGEPNFLYYIDKFYYFELSEDEHLMNYSGCGNDLRCNTPVGKRLIIESLKYLVQTFNVDGFRFDLAELIGKEVLLEIQRELKAIKPSLILICEPWSFRGHIIEQMKDTAYTCWNDGYREFIPKYLAEEGNFDGMKYFLAGSPSHATWPAQTVNYTESHDDFCWIDRITQNADNQGMHPTALDRRRTHLMFAVLFSSLGIPMLSAGQDMMRSKQGVHNTYQRGDLNEVAYNRALGYPQTVSYVRAWIAFRNSEEGKALRLFCFPKEGYFRFYQGGESSALLVEYNADRSYDFCPIRFAINPHHYSVSFTPACEETAHFVQIADSERFMPAGLSSPVLSCDREVTMPPFSCALWVAR